MKKNTTGQRLNYIITQRGLKQVDILDLAKPFCKKYGIQLRKNDLSQYVNGKVTPGQDKLFILACALNVSEAWLLGFDVPIEREYNSEQIKSAVPPDGRLSLLCKNYNELNEFGKAKLLEYSEDLIGNANYTEKEKSKKMRLSTSA